MNNRPCTSGYTLVEMLVVIAMASTLFAVAIGMIHRTMTLESTGRERAAAHRTAMRLATQFRQDIHQASDTTLLQTDDDEQGNLLVAIPGPTDDTKVTYTTTARGVLREQVLSAEQVSREEFTFPAGYQVSLSLLVEPRRAALTVLRETGHKEYAPREYLHTEAVIGRWQQSTPPGESAP